MKCSSCNEPITPVVAVDIDGTLGDYHGHFIRFAENYLGGQLRWDWDGSGEFSDGLGLDKPVYREIKLAYRQGGMKRSMPTYPFAKEFVSVMQERGIEVWIATTRPYLRLDNIDPDTRHWLNRHGIHCDALLYGEDKYDQLMQIVEPKRLLAVVDDLPTHHDHATKCGLRPIQHHTRWNAGVRRYPGYDSLVAISAEINNRLKDWRRRYGSEHAR